MIARDPSKPIDTLLVAHQADADLKSIANHFRQVHDFMALFSDQVETAELMTTQNARMSSVGNETHTCMVTQIGHCINIDVTTRSRALANGKRSQSRGLCEILAHTGKRGRSEDLFTLYCEQKKIIADIAEMLEAASQASWPVEIHGTEKIHEIGITLQPWEIAASSIAQMEGFAVSSLPYPLVDPTTYDGKGKTLPSSERLNRLLQHAPVAVSIKHETEGSPSSSIAPIFNNHDKNSGKIDIVEKMRVIKEAVEKGYLQP